MIKCSRSDSSIVAAVNVSKERIVTNADIVGPGSVAVQCLIANGVVRIAVYIAFESKSTYGIIVVIGLVVKERGHANGGVAGPGTVAIQRLRADACIPGAGSKAKESIESLSRVETWITAVRCWADRSRDRRKQKADSKKRNELDEFQFVTHVAFPFLFRRQG